jgi:hypothetical protein
VSLPLAENSRSTDTKQLQKKVSKVVSWDILPLDRRLLRSATYVTPAHGVEHSARKPSAFALDSCARHDVPHRGMQRLHGCSAAIASAGLASQEGELLTAVTCVDIMSSHQNHQTHTSQGVLDALPAGQAVVGTVTNANESRNLGKSARLAPDVPWR